MYLVVLYGFGLWQSKEGRDIGMVQNDNHDATSAATQVYCSFCPHFLKHEGKGGRKICELEINSKLQTINKKPEEMSFPST